MLVAACLIKSITMRPPLPSHPGTEANGTNGNTCSPPVTNMIVGKPTSRPAAPTPPNPYTEMPPKSAESWDEYSVSGWEACPDKALPAACEPPPSEEAANKLLLEEAGMIKQGEGEAPPAPPPAADQGGSSSVGGFR